VNDEQYRWLCDNRRFKRVRCLHDTSTRVWPRGAPDARSPLAAVVARAARRLRQRKRANAAWPRVADPKWLPYTWIDTVEDRAGGGSKVVIGALSAAVCYELRRRKDVISRRFVQFVPGVRDVAFVVAERGAVEGLDGG
jgi:hypothetical protein